MAVAGKGLFPYPQIPLKAGYAAHSIRRYTPLSHRIAGSYPVPYGIEYRLGSSFRTQTGLHTGRVGLSMPLEIAQPMQANTLPPSIHPELGVQCRHKGLHSCALQRIFRPFLRTG